MSSASWIVLTFAVDWHGFFGWLPGSGTLHDILVALFASAIFAALAWLASFLWHKAGPLLLIVWHGAIAIVTFKRYVLIWNDVGDNYSEALAQRLQPHLPRMRCKTINVPDDVRCYPSVPWMLAAIVFIVADVTKFSEDDEKRTKIENHIIEYLKRGGGMVGAHDIVYRRVRNLHLQEAFKVKTRKFDPKILTVEYQFNQKFSDHPIGEGLQPSFTLEDGELVIAEWEHPAEDIYTTGGADPKALVVANSFHRGRTVWLHSGDRGPDHLCGSLAKPQDEFVLLLRNSIRWVGGRHQQKAAARKHVP